MSRPFSMEAYEHVIKRVYNTTITDNYNVIMD